MNTDSDAGVLVQGISLSGFVKFDSDEGFAGVEVCQEAPRRCDVTDNSGHFVITGLMPESETLLVYRLNGYMGILQPMITPRWSTEITDARLYLERLDLQQSPNGENALLRDAGRPEFDWEGTRGRVASIGFGAYSSAHGLVELTDQVQVALDPPSGFGPFFNQYPSGEKTLEVSPGALASGGTFIGVEPHDDGYEIVYSHKRGDCRYAEGPLGGWPAKSGRPNATRVPARAGYTTAWTAEYCLSIDDAGLASEQ